MCCRPYSHTPLPAFCTAVHNSGLAQGYLARPFGVLWRTRRVRGAPGGWWAVAGAGKLVTWKGEFKLPWREAGPPNHHDDQVDSDQ